MKQVVISVPDEWLERTPPNLYDVMGAVMNGTVLPEHHGRLIDADALTISHGVFVPRLPGDAKVFYGFPMDAVFADEIKNAETIIPATKEGDGE